MENETTAGSYPASLPSLGSRVRETLIAAGGRLLLGAALLTAWEVSQGSLYTPASDLGYWLGVTGGTLMLVLLIYPLRKRFRALAFLGPLKHWFRFHLVAGIAGPLIVLFHSTFHVGSFNAAIALASMLLVVASGIVGRYLYRKIHNGLYGSRATAAELQASLASQMEALQPLLAQHPALAGEVGRYSACISHPPSGIMARIGHFLTLGWRRRLAVRRIRHQIRRLRPEVHGPDSSTHLHTLADTLNDALGAAQRTAQFSTYERLFSLWHVIHIPFLCMLVITAIVHVVAVHAY